MSMGSVSRLGSGDGARFCAGDDNEASCAVVLTVTLNGKACRDVTRRVSRPHPLNRAQNNKAPTSLELRKDLAVASNADLSIGSSASTGKRNYLVSAV